MSVTTADSGARPLRGVLLGLGTVGGAVASRLLDERWQAGVSERGGTPPRLVAVGVRDPERGRRPQLPAVELTSDLERLVARDDVDAVVELIGGLQPAGRLATRALERGTPVVTANKALVAEMGPALERTARRSGAALRFEAAVAAGIPILAPLARDLAANRVECVRGIVNGTTNFILTGMREGAGDYDAVLADAQRRGYAEADPTADVEGRDAVHKLVLLARLAFGAWFQPSRVRRTAATVGGDGRGGITGVTASEVTAAAEAGFAIKLVASVARVSAQDGHRLVGSVELSAVDRRSVLGSTDGVTNAIEVVGRPVGKLVFQGPGAGGDATSCAVLADLLALARGEGSTWGSLPEALPVGDLADLSPIPTRWFGALHDGAVVTESLTLEAARSYLRDRGATDATALYRVLEETAQCA